MPGMTTGGPHTHREASQASGPRAPPPPLISVMPGSPRLFPQFPMDMVGNSLARPGYHSPHGGASLDARGRLGGHGRNAVSRPAGASAARLRAGALPDPRGV